MFRFEVGKRLRVLYSLPLVLGSSGFEISQRLHRVLEQLHRFAACLLLGAVFGFGLVSGVAFRFELQSDLHQSHVCLGERFLGCAELGFNGCGPAFSV
jgi:hypothetical protein